MAKDRLLSGDRPILLILIFNVTLFTTIFLYDYTQYGYHGNQKVIGTILYKSNTIQRKYDTEVVWKEIDTGNSVQNRDTILTSEGSQAKLRLLDGTEIMIAENSMIFIDYLDNRANLEISVGGLQVTKRPDHRENPVGIRSGDGVLKLVEGIVNVEKKKNQKNLEYAILSGTIKPDPSNPFPMIPKKSLEGFEKLFPVSTSIQTAETIQSGAQPQQGSSTTNAGNSNSSVSSSSNSSSAGNRSSSFGADPNSSKTNENYGTYDNGNSNNRSGSNPNANANSKNNSGNPAGTGITGLNTKSGLKLERQNDSKNSKTDGTEGNNSSKTGYDPGDYINKQKYEQNKIQEKSDPTISKKKTETNQIESTETATKSGSTSSQEMKKTKPAREWTPEELLKQEKEKRRREREDKEQRDFLRM
ncbi:FecR family protein [Leptospira sp. WS92.C1]